MLLIELVSVVFRSDNAQNPLTVSVCFYLLLSCNPGGKLMVIV
jgi:hypothetical protein